MGTRHRKLLVILGLCSTVGLVVGLTMPAMAHSPTTNVQEGYPSEDDGDGHLGFGGAHGATAPDASPSSSEGEIISDVLDTGANFSAVTDTTATAYGWLGCTDPGGNPVTSTPGGACDVFGVDTSPKAGMMPVGSPAANYFRLQTKIPVDYEGGPFDLYGVACASDGNPATQPTDVNHCTLNTAGGGAATCAAGANTCVDSLHFDHTAVTTDHGATTGGRIESVQAGSTTCNSVAAHGCSLPNLQALTVTAVTGPAPNSADSVGFCVFSVGTAPFTRDTAEPSGATAPPTGGTCTTFALDGSPAAGPGGTDLWTVTIPAASLGSNTIDWLSITEHDDGSGADAVVESGKGDCVGDDFSNTGDDCQLDAVQLTFTPSGEGPAPPPPPGPPGPPPPPPPPGRDCPPPYDNIRGTRESEKIKGSQDCDKIRGLAGNDKLKGRGEDDKLIGGPGNDLLVGGGGNDICSGNAGRDRFRGCETIKKR